MHHCIPESHTYLDIFHLAAGRLPRVNRADAAAAPVLLLHKPHRTLHGLQNMRWVP